MPRRASTSPRSSARTRAARATSCSSCAMTPARRTWCSRRRTRPGRPTTTMAATASIPVGPVESGRAYKVSYNRPFTTRGSRRRPGLGVQRRVPDGALARGQWLRRQLHHRRRHRPRWRTALEPQGVPVGRSRRVLVRRSSARTSRRRAPRASIWRSSAATRCSGRRDGRPASTARGRPTARSSPTRRRTRTRRSTRTADVDGHLARPALQPARRWRPSGERADRHDLHGQ